MNFKKALLFVGCAVPICALLNCLVMFFTIEAESGFFRLGYDIYATFMLCLIAVLAVLSCVAFAKISRPTEPKYWPYVSCLAALILGVCLIADAITFKALVGTTEALAFFIRLFGIASGLVFLWRAASCLSLVPIFKPIYIVPVVYFLMKVVSTFIAYAAVATIPETVLELFAICAMLIFALNFAKAENGITNKKGRSFNPPLAVFCGIIIISQIAPYAANFFAKEAILIHANSLNIPTSLAVFLFIGVNVIFEKEAEKRVN